jgi:hypothetical protein
MITLRIPRQSKKLSNKMLAKCFMIVMIVAAFVPLANAEGRTVTSVVKCDPRTGKLVRVTVVHGAPQPATPPSELKNLIDGIAEKNQVEAPLVHSVIQAESNYNPLAVSSKGAQGLMQLIPATARRFGVKNSFDSTDNVEGGVKYLKYLLDLYHGDYSRAVAAYNAGEGAVARYGGVPPYKETRDYVAQVARRLETERKTSVLKSKSEAAPAQPAADDSAETYNPVLASVSPDGRIYYRTP